MDESNFFLAAMSVAALTIVFAAFAALTIEMFLALGLRSAINAMALVLWYQKRARLAARYLETKLVPLSEMLRRIGIPKSNPMFALAPAGFAAQFAVALHDATDLTADPDLEVIRLLRGGMNKGQYDETITTMASLRLGFEKGFPDPEDPSRLQRAQHFLRKSVERTVDDLQATLDGWWTGCFIATAWLVTCVPVILYFSYALSQNHYLDWNERQMMLLFFPIIVAIVAQGLLRFTQYISARR